MNGNPDTRVQEPVRGCNRGEDAAVKLENRTVLVTGAGRGIGRGIALECAKEGANVVINCRSHPEQAEAVAREIRAMGRRALVVVADVSDAGQVERMVSDALGAFGAVDVLVNNAGILSAGPIEEVSEEAWDLVMSVNLKGVFLCCKAVGRHMIERGTGGAVVNVASISGTIPEVNAGAYTPSKAGVIGLTRLLAMEWAPYGIRVNALSPGPVMTPLQRKSYPTSELLAARNAAVPLGRHGTPEEIGTTAVFLASDDASYITGEEIRVDGGSQESMFVLVRKLARRPHPAEPEV